MRKLSILLTFLFISSLAVSQAPSNDCADNPIAINACGTAFSITQAQMALATDGMGCSYGISCPINYVNGQAAENFDCNTGTSATGSPTGDDFNGSVENNMWWSFTPDESCDYDVTIVATNCCCKDKGSTNAAQFSIFDADAALPGGTIQNYMASNGSFTGTQTVTISVTQGQPVYIMLDGLNGTDCDISVTINPTANCSGCVIILPIELMTFEGKNYGKNNKLFWATASETNNEYFTIERSIDGKYYYSIGQISGAGNSNQTMSYLYEDCTYGNDVNYYRLKQTDFDGQFKYSKIISIDNRVKNMKVIRTINLMGIEVDETYKGLVIEVFENGSTRKVLRQ